MPRGPAPKPLEVRRKQGNPSRRPLPDQSQTLAIIPIDGAPVPMSLGPAGREVWRRLETMALWLSRVDLAELEDLCSTWDQITEMRAQIASEGLTTLEPIVTPAGNVVGERMVAHPLLKELRVAQKHHLALSSALGLDPAARSRLGLAEVKRQSGLEELQRRRAGAASQ